jgi:Co/Zn/Cd efflux system component
VDFITGIQEKLKQKFRIGHTTIQVEYGGKSGSCNDCN